MTEPGFSLAMENTKVVVLCNERFPIVLLIQFGETMVLWKPTVRFLSTSIDTEISFFEQVQNTSDATAAQMLTICQLMANA